VCGSRAQLSHVTPEYATYASSLTSLHRESEQLQNLLSESPYLLRDKRLSIRKAVSIESQLKSDLSLILAALLLLNLDSLAFFLGVSTPCVKLKRKRGLVYIKDF
jgi:hypothetical protein